MRTFKDCADCGARLDRVDWANGGLAWHEYDAILEPHAPAAPQSRAVPHRAAWRRPRAAQRRPRADSPLSV